MDFKPLHFIGELIEVIFDKPPAIEKKPTCPNGFIWRGTAYHIVVMLAEWHDYQRRGRKARNMQPQHATVAETRGSWGVGQFYFRVRVDEGRVFDIYYDRAPKNADLRKGAWFLYREMSASSSEP